MTKGSYNKVSTLDDIAKDIDRSGIRFVEENGRLNHITANGNGKISLEQSQYIFLEKFPLLKLGDKIILDLKSPIYSDVVGVYEAKNVAIKEDGKGKELTVYELKLIHKPTDDELKEFPISLANIIGQETKYYRATYY
ncbi:hypothetical protein HYX17_00270 [Candidatus Woesearchaeota archaeon]|nr:hypothetical protein [Candidatus Woesearchaeota archaeon]